MNDLSWFLYFVDVSQGVMPLVVMFGIALIVIGFVLPPKGVQPFERGHEFPFQGIGRLKNVFIGWCVALIFAMAIPSEDTLYMMAASEGGEAVVTSPQGKEVLDKINTIINNQLDELAKKKEQ
jgi:hypothetical protein